MDTVYSTTPKVSCLIPHIYISGGSQFWKGVGYVHSQYIPDMSSRYDGAYVTRLVTV